jgi:hypothetical protein
MTPRPRRPAGRQTPTKAGTEQVTPAPGTSSRSSERATRVDRAEPSGSPTAADLDERERRQSTTRKPAGPKRGRVTEDDVVVAEPKRRRDPAPPPTDPR